jgi:tetratricopeptide (TPR) repeat protein
MGNDGDLFGELQDRIDCGDERGAIALCRRRSDEIRGEFPRWQKIPDALRSDPAGMQRYANTLITVARVFAEVLDDPSLFERLVGTPRDNPIMQLQHALAGAHEAMAEHDYDTAMHTLEDALARTSGISGPHAEELLAVAIGSLGRARFHAGLVPEALADFEQALALCRAQGDEEGEAVYRQAVHEAHRWLGDAEGQAGPRVRVWAEIGDRRIDPDTLKPGMGLELRGSVRFVFERDRLGLGSVEALVERGREHGERGEYEDALECFAEAARRDPHDPEPLYMRGQTLMHLRRWGEAVEAYRRTEALAPGWYHCRTDGWVAEQIASGRAPEEAFELLVALEATEESELLAAGLAAWPDAAPLRLIEARMLARAGDRKAARAAAEAGLAVAAEPDIETRLLVELAGLVDEPEERERLLRRAVELGGNLVARATAQVMLAMA